MPLEQAITITTKELCPFCPQITEGSPFLIEKGEVVSKILSLEGHPLLVSTEHFTPLTIPSDIAAEIGRQSFDMLPKIFAFYQAVGVNIITNVGEGAGQEVDHVHTHLLPRFEQEARRFPKLVRKSDEERLTIARNLRAFLTSTGT